MSARFDNKRGLGAVYGVPALAGGVLSLEGGSKHLEIQGETASDRLKPGLHTLCPSFACEICGLAPCASGIITVTNLNDSGPGSLRQAIADATPAETIDFAVTGKITLTSGELVINKDLC